MCVVIDLDVVCLICLQPNKEMHPIHTADTDNSELLIAQKISILSELKIDQQNQNLPSKICSKCLQDLKAAWRFRKNCQAAVTIFQTIVKLDEQPQEEDDEDTAPKELADQHIKLPHGLQIKRINNDTEREENKKLSHTEECLLNNEKVASLYEEIEAEDFAKSNENNEFQTLEEAVEANQIKVQDENVEDQSNEDENTYIEYYITDDTVIDEISTKPDEKIHSQVNGQQKYTIQTKLEAFNKPAQKGRPRKQNVLSKVQTKRSAVQQSNFEETVAVDSANSSEDCFTKKPQSQVRPVKTRKRRNLSSDTKPPKICEICGNSYRFQHALNAHMRRHYNDKPFPCDFCDKAFVSNVELRRHMRVHTGQKPYACQYCERRFSDFGSRIKHERTHTGERPYHCDACGKSFAYAHVLSVHVRTHTGEKRFRCDYCSKGFTKKAYLLSHVEQHHSSSNNFQVIIDDTMDSGQNQMEVSKSEAFDECIYTTEFVNEHHIDEVGEEEFEDEDDDSQEQRKIIMLQPKEEDDEVEEIVEIQADEYTITVR